MDDALHEKSKKVKVESKYALPLTLEEYLSLRRLKAEIACYNTN
jgi:hypothetical protein